MQNAQNNASAPSVNERLGKLLEMLQKQPEDSFLLYAIALEYKKLGNVPQALSFLEKVIAKNDAKYSVAYHQAGLVHESGGDLEAARRAYRAGIAFAERQGDWHAKEEMAAALGLIES